MKLSDLNIGESGYIVKVGGSAAFRKRITEMGFVRGQEISVLFASPLGNPVTYSIMDYELSLRDSESSMIEVSRERIDLDLSWSQCAGGGVTAECSSGCSRRCSNTACSARHWNNAPLIQMADVAAADDAQLAIDVVLIGNPNSGKTSLFNAVSGGHERVGNYSGVTVTQKIGNITYKGYRINIVDLPGTYSLSAFSPEERYVQYYLRENTPDVVVNVVAASTLKRHLYLTTELMDRDMKMVGALNMYDELQKSGSTIDVERLAEDLGMPLIPMVAKSSQGVEQLLDKILELAQSGERSYPQVEINYGDAVGRELDTLTEMLMEEADLPVQFPPRYWALKMLERDVQTSEALSSFEGYGEWERESKEATQRVEQSLDCELNTEISARKYNFIDEVLSKSLKSNGESVHTVTAFVDSVVTHKWFGFPIFIALMWLTFSATFTLGAYPQGWIESGIEWLAEMVGESVEEGWLKSLLLDGVLGGVGGVLVFLPNIIILYLFIVIMEGTGYMVRAAFLMDRLMHCVGLDGRSFISMLMGFGCNVPAIMATRTIEDRKSRLITILTNPFMSCSARLPVYILLAGTFFPAHGGAVITTMYVLGIVVAGLTALIMARTIKKGEESPLILELPPYRFPTLGSIAKQLWYKSEHYIIRIGKVILLASLIIWTLDYFPRNNAQEDNGNGSYLSQIGKVCEPVMEPLGLDWRASVSLISGVAAKELIVSSLGVLYSTEASGDSKPEDLVEVDGEIIEVGTLRESFTLPSAVAYMIFVLLYFPCIGTLAAIGGETNRWKWIVVSVVYSTSVAWVLAWGAYNVLRLMGL
ncbi:MAG: ferrous iron transport protein B [Rikenellaceae bacterium]